MSKIVKDGTVGIFSSVAESKDHRYLGFSEEEFKQMLQYDPYANTMALQYSDFDYEIMQKRPTDGKYLIKLADRDFCYSDGIPNDKDIPYRSYSYAEPYSGGYALVRRKDACIPGFQFIDTQGKFSKYLTDEEVKSADPHKLQYYRSDFDMYLNNELDLEGLNWRYFYDEKDRKPSSFLRQIMDHETNNFKQVITHCKTSKQQDKLREVFERRAEWIKSVAYMVNNPQQYAEDLKNEELNKHAKELTDPTLF